MQEPRSVGVPDYSRLLMRFTAQVRAAQEESFRATVFLKELDDGDMGAALAGKEQSC